MVRFGHTLNDTFEEENPDENRNNEGEDTMMVPWKKRKRDQLSLSDDEDDYEDDYDPRVDRDHDDMREPWQMDDYDDDDQYQNDQYVRNRSSFMNRSSSSFRPSSTNQNHMYQQPHHNHIMQHHYQQHPMMSEPRMDMNPNFMQTHVPRNYDDYNEQYGDASYDMENKGSRKSKIIRNLFVVFIAWFFMRHTKELSPSMSYVSFFTTQMLSEIYILLKQDMQSLVSHVQKSSLFSGSNTSNNISSEQQRNKHCTISVPSVELPPILTKTLSPKFLDIYNAKVQHESEPSSTSNVANNIESSSISELFLLNNIVGQDRAMSVVSHAIDGWVDNMGPNSSETDYIKPMAMLFTGSDGVGKTETSFLLSKLFFSNCYNNIDGGDGGDGGDTDDVKYESVLLLHGQDFNDVSTKTTQQHTDQDSSMEIPSIYDQDQAVDQFSQNSVPSKERLRQKVLQHLYISQNQKKTTGSVIILTQVDQVHDLSTLDIFYDILNGSEKNPAITTTLSDEQAQQVEISTSHLLVIFTTDLATDRIFRMLQKYSSSGNTETESEIPKVEMTSAIRDALDSHWSPTSYSGRSRVNLGKLVNFIVPFMPLTHSDLVEIMRRKIINLSLLHENERWKHLHVTDSAIRYFVGTEFVEYIDARSSQNQNSHKLVFSKYGAHRLENGGPMHSIRAFVKRHMRPYRKEEVLHVDYYKGSKEVVLSWCKGNDAEKEERVGSCEVIKRLIDLH